MTVMSEAKATQQEPSMEEILASIRRIISEDTDPGKQPPAPPAPEPVMPEKPAAKPEVLELTEMVEEDGSVVNLRTAATKVKPVVPEPAPIVPPPPPPAPVQAADPAPVLPMPSDDALISSATAAAAASALSGLKATNKDMEPRTPPMPLGSNVTLEDLVRQELKPILKDWLDQNLKGIVERLVDREVRRLSRQADAD